MRYVARVYYIGFRAMGNRDAARRGVATARGLCHRFVRK